MNHSEKKTVYLVGGTGFIGCLLCRCLAEGSAIIVIGRSNKRPKELPGHIGYVTWDGRSPNRLAEILQPGCVVVNLAGQSVAVRWSQKRRQDLVDSRVQVTRALAEALETMVQPPDLLIQASGIGYYGPVVEQPTDETAPVGCGFLADLCRQWEEASEQLIKSPVRRIVMRLGVVLGRGGGFLKQAAGPFYPAVAVSPGQGGNLLPWIHEQDLGAAVDWFINKSGSTGVYNLTAPEPVAARDLYRQIARSTWLHWPLPFPSILIHALFGAMAREVIFSSQRIVPRRLLDEGFQFSYPSVIQTVQPLLSTIRGCLS